MALFRYCDDLVICCQYEQDAARIHKALAGRLAKYHLRLNEEKTQLVPFSKRAQQDGRRAEAFDFLGFTFYSCRTLRTAPIGVVLLQQPHPPRLGLELG